MASFDSFKPSARQDRAEAFIRALIEQFKGFEASVKNTKTDLTEAQAALRLALHSDIDEMNNLHYIKVATNVVSLQTKVIHLVGFIRDVERLGGRDVIALKVVNNVMNKSGHWPEQFTDVDTRQEPQLNQIFSSSGPTT